ncbi:MAG TPA: acyl-CoA synthetase [Prolixibacteraceae bacterium]|nr:acyl-CoA synthetase [Prolixibacteraceae bacterium]
MNLSEKQFFIGDESFSSGEILSLASESRNNRHLADWKQAFFQFIHEWFNSDDYVKVQTSGSTGEPKVIHLSKETMKKNALRTIQYFSLNRNDTLLLNLSCRYIAGKMMVVRALTGQMKLEIVDPSTGFSFLKDKTFQLGAMVPLQLSNLLAQPDGRQKVENIRHLLVGGSAVPYPLEQQIRQLQNNVVSTYGMTETASHIAIRTLSGNRASDLYHLLPGIRVEKDDRGCLVIHPDDGENETLVTNDVVGFISPESFRVLGRADFVIISGGLKFYPEQLEARLQPYIPVPVMISAVPDEKLGQKMILYLEAKKSELLKQTASEAIKQQLIKYERPREIRFLEEFSRTENGKLQRK